MRTLLKKLWNDECGLVITAEAAVVGTAGALGAIAGLHTVAATVNDELNDLSHAYRNLDQSYSAPEITIGSAHTAGSGFQQESNETSVGF